MYNWYAIDLIKQWFARRTLGRMFIAVVTGWVVAGLLAAFVGVFPNRAAVLASALLMLFVPSTIAVVTYHQLVMRVGRGLADGETHCRKCNYILRGISEPRCPECGERI